MMSNPNRRANMSVNSSRLDDALDDNNCLMGRTPAGQRSFKRKASSTQANVSKRNKTDANLSGNEDNDDIGHLLHCKSYFITAF